MSEFVFDTGEGESLVIPYISPKAYLEFLMNNCLDLVVGGARSPFECSTQLQAFWAAYRQQHSGHQVYRDCPDTGSLGYAVPLALHGDEGRGKRRTGTMAIFLETPLGLPTLSKKRKHCTCSPPVKLLDRFQTGVVPLGTETLKSVARQMMTNTKHHSFLQRWPLIVIPGVVYKAYPKIVDEFHRLLAKEMRILYYEGFQGPCGRVYTGVFVGLKADLKWHTKIGTLTRSYENQGKRQNIPCCHQCLSGTAELPWEDLREVPCWENTIFSTRPWSSDPPLLAVPFDCCFPEAAYRTDPFHTGKCGILRDTVGSAVFWWIYHSYLGRAGDLSSKLDAAHLLFRQFCHGVKATPALRSFTKAYYMYKSKKSFPWTNSKWSDTVLLLRWVVDQTITFLNNPIQNEDVQSLRLIRDTASNGLAYYDTLYAHGLFLDRQCAVTLYNYGNKFIAGYCVLAHKSLNDWNLFGLKPKLHLWRHSLIEIRKALEAGASLILSPLAWNCEPNEDSIGRLATLSRRLDSRGLSGRILQCYLVKGQLLYRRYKESTHPIPSKLKPLRPKRLCRSHGPKKRTGCTKDGLAWLDVGRSGRGNSSNFFETQFQFDGLEVPNMIATLWFQELRGRANMKRQFFLKTEVFNRDDDNYCSFARRHFFCTQGVPGVRDLLARSLDKLSI